MTDQDRGAYTPPTDEALAFDARRQSERQPVPMTLVGSAVVLVVLIVGVAVVYRGGVRGVDEAPRPIGQPVISVKTAPPAAIATANSVSAADEGESKSVAATPAPAPAAPLKAKPAVKVATASDAPTFAPAAEQPAPRPEPAAKTLALLDQPGQAVGPARVRVTPPPGKPIRTAGGLDASEVAAAGMTGAAPAHSSSGPSSPPAPFKVATATSKAAVAKPIVAKPVAPKPVAAAAGPKSIDAALASSSQVSGGPVVQIGAFSSAALSDEGYADVSRIMVGQMGGKAKHVMTVEHGGATLFRTWVSGFATRAQANAFCAALKAQNKPCFVKG
jgi:hypothetical protein